MKLTQWDIIKFETSAGVSVPVVIISHPDRVELANLFNVLPVDLAELPMRTPEIHEVLIHGEYGSYFVACDWIGNVEKSSVTEKIGTVDLRSQIAISEKIMAIFRLQAQA